MNNGGYIRDDRGFVTYVGNNIPSWKQEVDVHGRPMPQGQNEFGKIILYLLAIPIAIISLLFSLFTSLILKFYIRRIEPNYKILSFRDSFKILFKTSFVFQVINCIVLLIVYGMLQLKIGFSFLEKILNEAYYNYNLPINVVGILLTIFILCQIPSILLTGRVLQRKLSYFSKFRGKAGYLRATLFTAVIIMPIILIINLAPTGTVLYFLYHQYNH